MAAFRLAGRRALGAADPRQAALGGVGPRRTLERLAIGHLAGRLPESFEHRLRPLVGRTERVEPERRLAFRERVRDALAEAQHPLLDALPAAAARGPTGRGRLEDVR